MKIGILIAAAGAALLGTVSISDAGDRRHHGSLKDEYRPLHSWAGVYLGAHAGWSGADVDHVYDTGTIQENAFGYDTSGFMGGVYAGYNFQAGNIVVGIETDWSWSNVDGTGLCVAACPGTGTNPTFHLDTTGSVRGRLGYAVDKSLWFATAGVAFAKSDVSDPLQGGDDGKQHVGLIVGGGAEFKVARDISARAEYLFSDYGEKNYALVTTPDRIGFDTHTARVGITWHPGRW
jgi:outer membrane immunogenic protein